MYIYIYIYLYKYIYKSAPSNYKVARLYIYLFRIFYRSRGIQAWIKLFPSTRNLPSSQWKTPLFACISKFSKNNDVSELGYCWMCIIEAKDKDAGIWTDILALNFYNVHTKCFKIETCEWKSRNIFFVLLNFHSNLSNFICKQHMSMISWIV